MYRAKNTQAWVLSICLFVLGATAAEKGAETPRLLISHGVEASSIGDVQDAWFSALTDQYLYFRLMPVEGIEVIAPETLYTSLPVMAEFGKRIPDHDLSRLGRRLKATHLLTLKYEVSDGSVMCYAEVVDLDDNDIALTFDKEFALSELGKRLDAFAGQTLEALDVSASSRFRKGLKLPIIGSNTRSYEQLGNAIAREAGARNPNYGRAAQSYASVGQRDPSMALAFYLAAEAHAQAGQYGRAAQMLNHLIVKSALPYPSLYVRATDYYRENRAYDEALRIIALAERMGVEDPRLIAGKAKVLEARGSTEEARKAYAKLAANDPDHPDALLFSARRNNANKNHQKALEEAERLLEQGAHPGRANLEKGKALVALGKTTEALLALEAAVDVLPDNIEAHTLMADIYNEQGNYQQAAQSYEKALKGEPNNLDMLLKAAGAYRKTGSPEQALALLTANASRFYTSKILVKEMGELEYAMGDTANARKHLEAYLGEEPPDTNVFLMLGELYMAGGKNEQAIEMFEKALPLVKDKSRPRVALAKLYLDAKRPEKAEPHLKKIVAAQPDYPKANRRLGDLMLMRGKTKQALQYYLREREEHGADLEMQQKIAEAYFTLGDLENAEREFKKVIDIEPRTASAYFRLSVILVRRGKASEAQSYLSQGEVLGQADSAIYCELGKTYAKSGSEGRAIDAYKKCLAADPDNQDAWLELANVYKKAKQDSAAAAVYLKVYEIDPTKNSSYLAKAGHDFLSLGHKSEARTAYSRFVAQGYKDPTVYVSLAQIEFEGKNLAQVIKLLKDLEGKAASDPQVIEMLAFSYYTMSKYADALPYVRKWVAREPKDPQALEIAAICYDKTADLKNASTMYRRYLALKRSPSNPDYAFRLAEIYEERKAKSLAVKQYERNIDDYPKDVRNYERLAKLYLSVNRITDASELLAEATKLPSAPPRLSKRLAETYKRLGKSPQAASAYEDYLAKESSDSTAWLELAAIYYARKNYDKAIKPLTECTRLMPRRQECFYKLGYSYYKSGKPAQAVKPLKDALALDGRDTRVLELLVTCQRTAKDTTGLIWALRKQAAVDGKKTHAANVELGRLLLARGKTDEAIEALEAATTAKPSDVATHLKLVELYGSRGKDKKRLTHINAALRYDPDNAQIYFERASYHIEQNELSSAKTFLKKALKLDRKHIKAHYVYGTILKGERKYKEAYQHFNQAARYDPDNAEYFLQMAHSAHLGGNEKLVLETVDKALSLAPKDAKIMQWAGFFYMESDKLRKAESLLRKGLRADEDCPFCHEYLGEVALIRGDYRKAIEYLEEAVRRDEYSDRAKVKLANALVHEGDDRRAEELYERAFELNPKNDETLYRLCAVYLSRGKLDDAEEVLRRNKAGRTSGWISLAQAEIMEAQGNLPAAAISYNVAAKTLPDNGRVHAGLGRVYLAQEKYGDAIVEFGKAASSEQGNEEVLLGLAKAYLGRGSASSAKEYAKEVLRKDSDNDEAHYVVGRAESKKKNHIKAIVSYKRAIKRDGRVGKYYLALGDEYWKSKQYKDAAKNYHRAFRKDRDLELEAFERLGNVYYYNLKDERNARKFYQRYVDAGGTNTKVKMALRKLKK